MSILLHRPWRARIHYSEEEIDGIFSGTRKSEESFSLFTIIPRLCMKKQKTSHLSVSGIGILLWKAIRAFPRRYGIREQKQCTQQGAGQCISMFSPQGMVRLYLSFYCVRNKKKV